MGVCRELNKSMLGDAVEVCAGAASIDSFGPGGLTFEAARKIADAEAEKRSPEPMLLAWFNKKTGDFSPRVE